MNPDNDYRERWCDEKNVDSRNSNKEFFLKKLGSHASMTPMTMKKTTTSTTALNLANSTIAFEAGLKLLILRWALGLLH